MVKPSATLEIFRFHPEHAQDPVFQRYEVPYREDWVVLDAINYIKDYLDGTLAYRWSCRMGVCGSCGMMINGVPRLSCATFLKEFQPHPIRVEPLANFPVHRDLVIAMDDFMDKLPRVAPWIVRENEGFYALLATCTHLGCSPNWLSTENKFKCPCHGSGFYPTGINFEGPAPRPLERARIVLADDGQILIDKNVKFQQEKGQWESPGAFLVFTA